MRHRQSLATNSASSPPIKSPNNETPRNKGPETIQKIKDPFWPLFLVTCSDCPRSRWVPRESKFSAQGSWTHSSRANEGGYSTKKWGGLEHAKEEVRGGWCSTLLSSAAIHLIIFAHFCHLKRAMGDTVHITLETSNTFQPKNDLVLWALL